MNADIEIKKNQFKKWYHSNPKAEIPEIRRRVIDTCGISVYVFYNWLSGVSPVPVSSQIVINQIAGKKVFEVPELLPINNSHNG